MVIAKGDAMDEEPKTESVYLDYIVRDWTVVSGMAGKPDRAPEPERFHLHQPRPPSTHIEMNLKGGYRTLHINRDENTWPFEGVFHFRINGNDKDATEGAVRHGPEYSGGDESLYGGISLPEAQFQWLLGELAKPHARLHLWMILPLLAGNAVPYDAEVDFSGFTLNVTHGPGAEYRPEPASPEPSEPRSSPAPVQAPAPRDERLTWIVMLLACILGALVVGFWRLSP
jgi:hypothetical protein